MIQIAGSFKEANSSFIALEDMDTDVAIMLIEWIQEDKYGGIAFHVGRKTHTKVLSRLPDSAELNWTRCMRVLMAADKFQVHTLVSPRKACSYLTMKNNAFKGALLHLPSSSPPHSRKRDIRRDHRSPQNAATVYRNKYYKTWSANICCFPKPPDNLLCS